MTNKENLLSLLPKDYEPKIQENNGYTEVSVYDGLLLFRETVFNENKIAALEKCYENLYDNILKYRTKCS